MSNKTKPKLEESFIDHVRKLAQKGEKSKSSQQPIFDSLDDEFNESKDVFSDSFLKEIQNPSESHSLYYSTRSTMRKELPHGKQYEELRKVIYEEKNIYINGGKKLNEDGIRGSDGRMAYLHNLRVTLSVVQEWLRNGGNSWDLYCIFRLLNEKLGYHEEKYFPNDDFNIQIKDMFGNAWKHHNANL